MTGTGSARRTTRSAGSTRSPSRGRCWRVAPIRRVRQGRWPRSRTILSATTTAWRCCSGRPSTRRGSIPATSRVIRPACARTAGNTATPPCGPSWLSRSSVRAIGRASCSPCSIRSTTRASRRRRRATRSSPMSWRPTSIRCRRMSDGADGPGTRVRPPGCIAPASKAFSASAARESSILIDPCIPAAWPGFEATIMLGSARYDIRVENPSHRCRGISRASVDEVAIPCPGGRVRVPLGGEAHRLLISM